MLKVAFILAALLAAEGAVLAHPINNAHGNGSPSIITPSNIQSRAVTLTRRSLMEDLYNSVVDSLASGSKPPHPHGETIHVSATAFITPHQDWVVARGYDDDDVEARGLSDLEDLETRAYWDADEDYLERRSLDDESMELMARESDGGELDARDFDDAVVLVPRRSRSSRRKARIAKTNALPPPVPQKHQLTADTKQPHTESTGTDPNANGSPPRSGLRGLAHSAHAFVQTPHGQVLAQSAMAAASNAVAGQQTQMPNAGGGGDMTGLDQGGSGLDQGATY
jgi:hypothetical protein